MEVAAKLGRRMAAWKFGCPPPALLALTAAASSAVTVGLLLLLPASTAFLGGAGAHLLGGAPPPGPWAIAHLPLPRPSWCDPLMALPLAAKHDVCEPETVDNCPPGQPPRMYSHEGQDWWLWMHHFRHATRPGTFVEAAAYHPYALSNSYFLEACAGWRGLCIEASSSQLRDLYELRSCALVPLCVSDTRRTVTFVESGALGGIEATNKHLFNATGDAMMAKVRSSPRRVAQCTTLGTVLARSGVAHVDYLSVDLEGAEAMALRGIDWDAVRIDFISLERNGHEGGEAAQLLQDRGYRMKVLPALEAMFIHPEVVLGQPQ